MHSLQRKRLNGHVTEEKSNEQISKCRTDVKTLKKPIVALMKYVNLVLC